MLNRIIVAVGLCAVSCVWCCGQTPPAAAAPAAAPAGGVSEQATPEEVQEAISKGIAYLKNIGQKEDGSYSPQFGPGVTALATMAVIKNGRSIDDPQVAKSLKYLEACVQPDGSITAPKPGTINYDTSICLTCFALANKDGRYDAVIANAKKFLDNVQRDEGEGQTLEDADYGGYGYTPKTPGGDLSNTHMVLDALEAMDADQNDPAIQRAIIFVSRCQNLESHHNTLPFSAKVNDGGFYYSPCGEGYSAAGKTDEGALRSYASMTYAGLKSLVFAGVNKDDPRVKAATKWLQSNYSVEENPGLGTDGLYYYYHLMAKCLDALGGPEFVDADGVKHNWPAELGGALAKRQSETGAWMNENHRWYESDANLATSFALLALAHCEHARNAAPEMPPSTNSK